MDSSYIKSIIKEKVWLFQLKYAPFHAEWMVVFSPFIWVLLMPYWLPKMMFYLLQDKNPLIKMVIVGIVSILLLSSIYLYAIVGKPDQEKWRESIFSQHIDRIAVKIYDRRDNMIGGLVNRGVESNKGVFYVQNVPKLYWDILKSREEHYLDFNNTNTGLMGIFENHRSFNGVDPMGVPNAILRGRGGSSLSQQLVKNFYGQDFFREQTSLSFLNTILRKWKELNEAKSFYHNLRMNNGEEFKRWIAMYSPSLVSAGSVYGLESVSATVFGKKPKDLLEYEQVLLSNMYKFSHYFNGKAHDNKCEKIKAGSKRDVESYFKNNPNKVKNLNENIDNWVCVDKPRVPFGFYRDMLSEDIAGRLKIGNPNNRIWDWAGTSASILRFERDEYLKKHPNHLIIEAKLTVDVPKNVKFKKGVDQTLKNIEDRLGSRLHVDLNGDEKEEKREANIWISVVDSKGEIRYIYKRGNTSYKRRIGSVSKIFEAIALGNRGDRYNTFYCNEPFEGLHNSDGSSGGECKDNSNNNIYSAKEVFGASKNLPMRSALDRYVSKSSSGIKIIEDEISIEKLEQIYKSFNLSHDNNNTSIKYELSFGLTNSNPFELQKSIHKLTHLLYPNGSTYREAHISRYLKYKVIKNSRLIKGETDRNLYQKPIDKKTMNMFNRDTKKIYMQSVLKSSLDSRFGTLRSFNSISGFKPLFMKSGSTDKSVNGEVLTQSKWVAGAVKVKGEKYSFLIMVDSENGIGKSVKHHEMTKPIFNEIIKALNDI